MHVEVRTAVGLEASLQEEGHITSARVAEDRASETSELRRQGRQGRMG